MLKIYDVTRYDGIVKRVQAMDAIEAIRTAHEDLPLVSNEELKLVKKVEVISWQ